MLRSSSTLSEVWVLAIVRNVYANNPGKLAAWLSASHVEKALKKKTTPTP